MKFQIILESLNKQTAKTPDDEFEKIVRIMCKNLRGFKLVGARSLEGIQEKIWQPAVREKDPLE